MSSISARGNARIRPILRRIPIDAAADGSSRPTGAEDQSRLVINLNSNWRFRRVDANDEVSASVDAQQALDDSDWDRVNLPHSVRLEPLSASGGRNFQGICWYRRALHIRPEWRDRVVYLHSEGAMQLTDVWLNSRLIASHDCGYTPFTVDVTPHLDFAPGVENLLSLRLDNRDNADVPPGKPQSQLDFCYFGGLYRNVRMIVMNRLHISDPLISKRPAGGGVFVTCPSVSKEGATVAVQAEVRNECSTLQRFEVRHELFDADGHVLAVASTICEAIAGEAVETKQTMRVQQPRLWHPYHPHLYTLQTTVCDSAGFATDEVDTRIGIRHIQFDPDSGLLINGEKFTSIGANRHQDHPYVGYALPDSAHWRDVKKLREGGFTSVRSHYPQAPAFMDACDELGMLAIVSNPGWQFVGGTEFRERALRNARAMVRRDRNHPCVVLWEAALNESNNGPIAAALQQAVHEECPCDQCYTAGDRETDSAGRVTASWDVEYWQNDGSKPYWIREWGDRVDNWSDQQSANRVARGWGETPMLIQAHSHLAQLDEIFKVGHHGTSSGPDGKRIAGACLWAAIDCQRGYHHQPFYGGPLDVWRLPKFSYHFFRSQRPPEVRLADLDSGAMVFIANFASFLSPKTVTIFSNCDEVRLIQDGKVIGVRKPDQQYAVAHPPFTFEVESFRRERSTMYMTGIAGHIEPAELMAEGLIGGCVVAIHSVRPPGVPHQIVLEADLCGRPLLADGADWVRVYAHICDARGTVCPLADDVVQFQVESEGRIINNAEIGADAVRAEAGIASAMVQSTARPGKLIVRASSFGLVTAQLELTTLTTDNESDEVRPESGTSAPRATRVPEPR